MRMKRKAGQEAEEEERGVEGALLCEDEDVGLGIWHMEIIRPVDELSIRFYV